MKKQNSANRMITRDSKISEHGRQVIPVTDDDVSLENASGMTNSQEKGNGTALSDIEENSQDDVEVKKGEENDKETENESKESENIPVDRDWAWVIMICQFTLMMLMIGYGRALSIFFLEFQKMFNTSVTMGTITFALMTTAFGVGNLLVTNVLLTSENSRKMVIVGSLLTSTCICLSALSPSISFFLVCHFVIGLSNAFSFIPSALLLGHYFKARRAFATSVGNAGFSVGNLVFPPLAQYLSTTYGTRGAILLIGGVCMQSVIAASLCRPVSFYTKRFKYRTKPTDDKIGLRSCDGKYGDDCLKETNDTDVSESDDFERSYELRLENGCQGKADHARQSAALASREASSTPLPSSVTEEIVSKSQNADDECNVLLVSQTFKDSSPNLPKVSTSLSRHVERVLSTSDVSFCGSSLTLNATLNHTDCVFRQKSALEEQEAVARCNVVRSCTNILSKAIDFSLTKNWLFRMLVIYQTLSFTAGLIVVYFPSLAVNNGMSRESAAVLMTVMGSVDLVSRLALGFVADLGFIKKTHLVAAALVVLSCACHFVRFYTSFVTLAMFAVVYGVAGGVSQNLFTVITIDLLGIQNLGKTMSFVYIINSAFASVNHPLIGLMVDGTGTYIYPFNYIGVCLLLSAACILLEPFARRLENARMRRYSGQDAVHLEISTL